jgi:hypothetical protein
LIYFKWLGACCDNPELGVYAKITEPFCANARQSCANPHENNEVARLLAGFLVLVHDIASTRANRAANDGAARDTPTRNHGPNRTNASTNGATAQHFLVPVIKSATS